MQNSIGEFEFLSLLGQPERVRQELELITRPGVNGVGLWQTGYRPRPFLLRSMVDAQNKSAARNYYKLYCDLIGADPVPLVWSDLNLEGEGTLYAVLDVRPVVIASLAASSGGLHAPSLGWIECDWTLIAVPNE